MAYDIVYVIENRDENSDTNSHVIGIYTTPENLKRGIVNYLNERVQDAFELVAATGLDETASEEYCQQVKREYRELVAELTTINKMTVEEIANKALVEYYVDNIMFYGFRTDSI